MRAQSKDRKKREQRGVDCMPVYPSSLSLADAQMSTVIILRQSYLSPERV